MKEYMLKKNNKWIKTISFLFVIYSLLFSTEGAFAQPKKSRLQQPQQQAQQKQQQGSTNQGGMTQRMQLMYPTAADMPEEVVWRRDIYRELDLNEEENAGLYDPVEPQGKRLNLFTYVFKLALNGYIPVYEYNLDGNEVLEASAKVDMKTILDNYHIFYEENDGKVKVDNSDIPSAEVKMYYLKECAYFDQANSTFRIKPIAFCPVMLREDDFGGEAAKYPLFWVKYSEVEPFLSRQTVKTSDYNDAAQMTMDDYFTRNKYKGKIYKTANRLGKTLAQIAGNDSTKYSDEQKRIEAELEAFRKNIFGDKEKRDSLDSIANTDPKQLKANKKQAKDKTSRVKSRRSSSGGSSGSARVSVRRERH